MLAGICPASGIMVESQVMRILYLSQYFPPEVGATQTRAHEMARYLVSAGHQVTLVAELPNHPTGIIPPEWRGRPWRRDTLDGIDVLRVWVKTTPKKTFATRMAFYLSYMVNAFLAGLFLARGRVDVVVASSPPLFVACAGWALGRARRAPFVFEVRDLWPAAAVSMGELRNPRFIRLAESVEHFLYRHAAAIVAVTRGFARTIQAGGIPAERIVWIPNGTTPELFDPAAGDGGLRQRLGLEGKFVVTFAGLHGLAQGLPAVLEAAGRLRLHPEIVFLFVGEGPVKESLLAIKERERLDNVLFLPAVPREEVVAYLNLSDALLVPLKADPVFETFVPSKLFDCMACARPVILSVPGESHEILDMADAGVYCPPEDPEAMAGAILTLARDPALGQTYGRRGREFVTGQFSRAAQARELEKVLTNVVARGKRPTRESVRE